jgi:hypothetical protein
MEVGKILMEAFDIKENPDKNDLTIVKRGLSVELAEARDIAGHIQWMTGETTVASFKEHFEKQTPAGRLGNVITIISAHEKCPFLAFMKRRCSSSSLSFSSARCRRQSLGQ